MKRIKIMAIPVCLCLLLSGCMNWMDGNYSSVNPHQQQEQQGSDQIISVETSAQLRDALVELVETASESALISVAQMDQTSVSVYMDTAVQYVLEENPIGAYAVDSITYEQGTNAGQPALSVSITYNHNRAEILRITQVRGAEEMRSQIADALDNCSSGVVMLVEDYDETDFIQLVEDYADENPDSVMETPQVRVSTFPETGSSRVVELIFTYQSSREVLRSMQSRVTPLFASAELYVRGDGSDNEKYSLLYAFLMERTEYEIETSITPSYSLLLHGVGDSKAFAIVFSAMCRRAGLECLVVSGTSNGESLFWNIICDDGIYYHVDLLSSSRAGEFQERTDDEMRGYVWDYSAYPACGQTEE